MSRRSLHVQLHLREMLSILMKSDKLSVGAKSGDILRRAIGNLAFALKIQKMFILRDNNVFKAAVFHHRVVEADHARIGVIGKGERRKGAV